ncbi:MAG TPA: sensor histidine kinase, partial [Salinimicrobium sp.]|nr:sensor histidine kinase [Salinimicrobium sp.]
FNPKAHILTLLGEELIKSPVMAIYELVKNSYDADSKKVDVYFRDIENAENAAIIIEDDGTGMTNEIIEDVWLEPGSDFRKPVNSKTGLREITKSPLYKRIPMGEKGVGRFAVHKLGSKILLITRPLLIEVDKTTNEIKSKTLADYEIQLYINWKDFSQSKHLSDIPIKWKVKKDFKEFRFKKNSGTYIHLSGLKESWTKGMARQLKGQSLSMLSPKVNEESFKINLNFDNQWIVDFPTADKILEDAPYKITAFIDGKYNLDFEYDFSLKNNEKIGSRKIINDQNYNKNLKGDIRSKFNADLEKKEFDKESINNLLTEFDANELPFGNLIFEFYSFDLDSASMRDYTDNPYALKNILKEHSGIKVFKGDMRVYDYGEPGIDWLGLDLKRVQNKEWFSNNQNIGYVFLDPETSGALIEKTNREGFINNAASSLFILVLEKILTEFKATRSSDRNKWLKFNQKETSNLFDSKINAFKTIVEDTSLGEEERKQLLLSEAKKLEDKYEEDKNTLLIPAGVGMTASVALHEIEKLVPRMEETVKSNPIKIETITDQVDELKQYTEGIISVLRKGGNKPIDIKDSIFRSFSNYKLKLSNRKIDYSIDIEEDIDFIKCDKRYFITMIMNIIDNSIYWLNTLYKKDKLIFVKAFKNDSYVHIIIADNGPGFKDDITDLIRPFFSRKDDGIGIGMYLIDTIMMKYGKFNIITSKEEMEARGIPDIYTGAVVELVFNKNQE